MSLSSAYTAFVLYVHLYLVLGRPELNGDQKPLMLYSREDWGAVPSTDVRPLKTPVPYVIIHHTYLPPACNTTEKCKMSMKAMQSYHISQDFGDIGYNFCVGSDGYAYEGRGWNTIGIHAGPANNFSIGICLIGDWRVDQPPEEMLETTKSLINTGVQNGIISPTYKLKGHSQVMATECPGTTLLNIISTWNHYSEGKFASYQVDWAQDLGAWKFMGVSLRPEMAVQWLQKKI